MRVSRVALFVGIVATSFAGAPVADAAPTANAKPTYAGDVAPFLAKHCVSCHTGKKAKGGVAFDVSITDEAVAVKDKEFWEKVAANLRTGDMPPPNKPHPPADELDVVNRWLDTSVFGFTCAGQLDPGRVTVRRLNRAEYNNTIRDLFGLNLRLADEFPADDVGYGFDNIGDVLSMPPILMEKYIAAAEKIVNQVWKDEAVRKRILFKPLDAKDRGGIRQILRKIGERAYRRPMADDELKRLMRFVDLAEKSGENLEAGVRLALQAILVSPHFLFRIEMDPNGSKDSDDKPHRINDWELASRLSYFLWSSMPDDQLFQLAREGNLHKPEVLETQVRRMLKDAKMRGLTENFADQWLQLRNLKGFAPDLGRFPKFDEPLREAMLKETELFFDYIVHEDRNVMELVDADYTFVNERLGRHYGLANVKGAEFRKVSLAGTPRGGVLTQASVLAVTSNPTRTSPVKRGKWVLETLLGTPPPPPPPGVEELKDDKPARR